MIIDTITEQGTPTAEDRVSFTRRFLEKQGDLARMILQTDERYQAHIEDILQETYCRGLRNCHQLHVVRCFWGWVSSIARHVASDMVRTENRLVKYNLLWFDELSDIRLARSLLTPLDIALDTEEQQVKADFIASLTEQKRQFIDLRCNSNMSLDEIAAQMGVSTRTIHNWIRSIRTLWQRYRDELLVMAVTTHFSSENLLAATMQTIKQESATYPELAAFTATAGVVTAGEAVTGSGVMATVSASTGTTTAFSFGTALSPVGVIGLWIVSLWRGFQVWGTAAVQNAPTPEVRRWLLKHLMICYCCFIFLVTLPFNFFLLNLTSTLIAHEYFDPARWIVLGIAGCYVVWLPLKYWKIVHRAATPNPESTDRVAAAHMRGIIRAGAILSSMVLFGCLAGCIIAASPEIKDALDTPKRNVAIAWIVILSVVTVILSWFHIGTLRRFLKSKAISTDAQTAQRESAAVAYHGMNTNRFKPRDIGLIVGVLLTMTPVVLHLVVYRTRPWLSCLELIGFGILWLLIRFWNTRSEKRQGERIVFTIVVLLAMILALRDIFWLHVM